MLSLLLQTPIIISTAQMTVLKKVSTDWPSSSYLQSLAKVRQNVRSKLSILNLTCPCRATNGTSSTSFSSYPTQRVSSTDSIVETLRRLLRTESEILYWLSTKSGIPQTSWRWPSKVNMILTAKRNGSKKNSSQ
jgi:hypothetical protein